MKVSMMLTMARVGLVGVLFPLLSVQAAEGARGLQMEMPKIATYEATIQFGFFDTTEVREPTEEEVDNLMERTKDWMKGHLQEWFPSLRSLRAVLVGHKFNPPVARPVSLDVMLVGSFRGEEAPTDAEFFNATDSLDFNAYIQEAVWGEGQNLSGIFFETEKVLFASREEALTIPNPVYCGNALEIYHASDGKNYTEVSLECMAELCSAGSDTTAVAKDKAGHTAAAIACGFSEHTTESSWADCVTNTSDSTTDLGELVTFSDEQWGTNNPVLVADPITNPISEYETPVTLAIAHSCGGDGFVYLLMHSDGDMYQVVGHQTLQAFTKDREALEGLASSTGSSSTAMDFGSECEYGGSTFTDLQASCKLADQKAHDDAEEEEPEPSEEETATVLKSGAPGLAMISSFVGVGVGVLTFLI